MYLTSTNLVYYLTGRGTITRSSVIEGDFQVHELNGRNRCFKVVRQSNASLFVKQIKVIDDRNIQCLAREAACYRLGQLGSNMTALAQLMPRFVDFDPVRYTLIVELLPGSEDLRECHRRLGCFPAEIARSLGSGLAKLHVATEKEARQPASPNRIDMEGSPEKLDRLDVSPFPRETPWILSAHLNAEHETGTDAILAEIVRNDTDWKQAMDAFRDSWRRDCLIHGDLKWDNCLVFPGADGGPEVRLVDWEMADYGDWAWDVGGVFQAYWSMAILTSLRESKCSPTDLSACMATVVAPVQPALEAFWMVYQAGRGWESESNLDFLDRCLRCGGARMMQTTFEYAGANGRVNDRALAMFRICREILQDPRRAVSWIRGAQK